MGAGPGLNDRICSPSLYKHIKKWNKAINTKASFAGEKSTERQPVVCGAEGAMSPLLS